MRPDFVELNRTFTVYDPTKDQESLAEQSYLESVWGHSSEISWAELQEYGCAVILGEAGSGKTWEFEAQAERLSSTDQIAIFIRLESLAAKEVRDILSGESLQNFHHWLQSKNTAYFFLDAIEESRLKSFHAFEQALENFSRSLGSSITRARIILSSRITQWRGNTDNLLVQKYLSVGQKQQQTFVADNAENSNTFPITSDSETAGDKKNTIVVVVINPLNQDQARKLAAKRTNAADEFIAAINENDAWDFSRRPLDVEDLVDYWNEHGSLASLSTLQEFTIERKLEERNPQILSVDPLSFNRARVGAETLAATVTFCRQFEFLHPDAEMVGLSDSPTIYPRLALPHWLASDLKALFARPLFDGASYARVRFHHRRSVEYLTACWLDRLTQANLPMVALDRLLFRQKHAITVIAPSLAPVAAWLSANYHQIRSKLIELDPDILLRFGDPNLIPLSDRRALLQRLSTLTARRLDRIDAAQMRRLADPCLIPDLNTHLLDEAVDVHARELLLEIIRHGRLVGSADAVLSIASNPAAPRSLRCSAFIALRDLNDTDRLTQLATFVLTDHSLGRREAQILCRVLYPEFLDEIGLETLIRLSPAESSDGINWLAYSLKETVPTLDANRIARFVHLLTRLSSEQPWHIVNQTTHERVSTNFRWLYEPLLLATCQSLQTISPTEANLDNLSDTIEQLTRLHKVDDYHHSQDLPLQEPLASFPVLRQSLFWRRVTALRSRQTDSQIGPWHFAALNALWHIEIRDLPWLLEEARTRADVADRVLAIRIATQLWRRNRNRDRLWGRQIRQLSRSNSALKEAYRREFPIFFVRFKGWLKFKKDQLSFSFRSPRWRRALSGKWRQVRIFCSAIRNIRSLRAQGPMWLLFNLVYVNDLDKFRSNYSDFEINEISQLYGDFIANAARLGIKECWKHWESPPRGSDLSTGYYNSSLALVGIQTAIRDGLDITSITSDEARIAAGHALYELNGLPDWMSSLASQHSESVLEVFRPQIDAEFQLDNTTNAPIGLIYNLNRSTDVLRELCAPQLLSLIENGDPANYSILGVTIDILAKCAPSYRSALLAITPGRTRAARIIDRVLFLRWFANWLNLDALSALDFLEELLSDDPDSAENLVVELSSLLYSDRDQLMGDLKPDFQRLPALRRFVPLLFQYIRPASDLVHQGVYSPGARDHAQEFRSAALNWLIQSPDEETFDAMVEIAQHQALENVREWLDAKITERAKLDAETSPWVPKDIGEFVNRYENPPTTPDALFETILGRLADIKENAENGDFSLKRMFDPDTSEEFFQKIFADRLDAISRGNFQVAREVEVSDHNLPDIRIFLSGVGIVTIEVKIANKWSYNQLRTDALENQLVGQYMRVRESRHGLLLLVNLQADRRWRLANNNMQGFSELCEMLNQDATELSASRGRQEKIAVVCVDLS